MKLLEDRILADGEVIGGKILKVSNFLNHQIDVAFLDELALEWKHRFEGVKITKILTIESSGIAIGASLARVFGVPLVFAKKHQTSNVNEDVYSAKVFSFTHDQYYNVVVSKKYISKGDCVLLADDFLANGNALKGLIEICKSAGAALCGAACAIEKGFQNGGDELRKAGLKVESLAIIDKMDSNGIEFRKEV
ncbi:xanthine phosphoribosyltransferase [Treponema sp.]|uniref:xanthine phosphoribosyltransferase n=1 Tax=Treponema sp. TaxID=166 RepID=UPI00388D04D0